MVIGIILVSLIYTISAGRTQKAMKGEFDSQLNENVQNHPYLRNPIFLAIGFFFVFVVGYILYLSFR
ncbi:hypothetical protein D0463_00930 [Bacillus sp. V59.32b]|nr:hypothetical protein D0463_00930 [Bacillus sp. V59.32b]